MNRARLLRSLRKSYPAILVAFAAFATLSAPVSCSTLKDSEATVPAERGAVQPDGGGALVPEAEACSELTAGESSARSALHCDAVVRTCPGAIRPAGNDACYLYDQASIDGCVSLFRQFTRCEEFDQHPCLITVRSPCDTGEGGGAGALNNPGGAGSAGDSGSAGSAGESTSGGSAGSLGSAGDTNLGAGVGGA